MLRTYKAILRGNRVEWSTDAPGHLPPEHPIPVHVTLLDEPAVLRANLSQGQRMAAALEQLSTDHTLAELSDPAAWECEMRGDRPLPGRET